MAPVGLVLSITVAASSFSCLLARRLRMRWPQTHVLASPVLSLQSLVNKVSLHREPSQLICEPLCQIYLLLLPLSVTKCIHDTANHKSYIYICLSELEIKTTLTFYFTEINTSTKWTYTDSTFHYFVRCSCRMTHPSVRCPHEGCSAGWWRDLSSNCLIPSLGFCCRVCFSPSPDNVFMLHFT